MEQYCKKSGRNHKNDLKLFETPDLSWLTADQEKKKKILGQFLSGN